MSLQCFPTSEIREMRDSGSQRKRANGNKTQLVQETQSSSGKAPIDCLSRVTYKCGQRVEPLTVSCFSHACLFLNTNLLVNTYQRNEDLRAVLHPLFQESLFEMTVSTVSLAVSFISHILFSAAEERYMVLKVCIPFSWNRLVIVSSFLLAWCSNTGVDWRPWNLRSDGRV